MKGRVALIIPYFGSWPKWFNLYLLSCSKQVGLIDFYFFTDCTIPKNVFDNTTFIQTSFEDYCNKVSLTLGITFKPSTPYKLTDLKPYLGHVHKDIVEEYEFWAFGDIDLIYGDMSIVLSDVRLKRKDFITTHSERVAGHFSAIRVKSSMFAKCFDITDWKSKLENDIHMGLDEGDYSNVVNPSLIVVLGILRRILGDVDDKTRRRVCTIVWKYLPFLCRRVSFEEYDTTPVPTQESVFFYYRECGIIRNTRKSCNLPYLHFLFFKKTPYLITNTFWDESTFYDVPDLAQVIEITQKGIRGLS